VLNNLRLLPPALLQPSPLRDSLTHLNINGCQSINKSAIDALLRLTHCHLPKLQRIHMEGLRLELCQQAAKSFLREKLKMLDSLGTTRAFTLGQKGRPGASNVEEDLTATHLTHWIRENSQESRIRMLHATTIANLHPQGLQWPDFPDRRVPFYHSVNLFNMPQTGMFRKKDGTLRIPQWHCTPSGTRLVPEVDPTDPEAGLPQIFTPWSENETQLMHRLFPKPDSLCLNFGRTGVFQWNHPNSSSMTQTTEWPQKVAGHTLRSCEMAGLTHTWMEPHPHMPYVIFRNMGPVTKQRRGTRLES